MIQVAVRTGEVTRRAGRHPRRFRGTAPLNAQSRAHNAPRSTGLAR